MPESIPPIDSNEPTPDKPKATDREFVNFLIRQLEWSAGIDYADAQSNNLKIARQALGLEPSTMTPISDPVEKARLEAAVKKAEAMRN